VIALMSGVHQLIGKLLYGSGLRITEYLRLRVQDVDLEMKALTVRSGKGDKDRITTFPEMLVQPLKEHLVRMYRWGTDIRTIQTLPGHAHVNTTMITPVSCSKAATES